MSGPRIDVVARTEDQLGETPLWRGETGELSWIDIERPRLHRLKPGNGSVETTAMPGTYFGCQALMADGCRLVATDCSLQVMAEDGTLSPFAGVEEEGDTRLNDGRVDSRGRLWIGTMDNGLKEPHGNLYRVDPDGTVTRMVEGVVVSNGIAFSPDGDRLYFTDTRRNTSFAFDLDLDDGAITNRRVFADYRASGDRPDGACVDAEGCLWAAFFAGGRIVRYRPDGGIDRSIEVPVVNPTCVAFGGRDLTTLYVTSATKFLTPEQRAADRLAGSLLAIAGLGQGLPENHFGQIG